MIDVCRVQVTDHMILAHLNVFVMQDIIKLEFLIILMMMKIKFVMSVMQHAKNVMVHIIINVHYVTTLDI